jgi:hypothetical protein
MRYYIVSEVARKLGVNPREISDAFYQRLLDDARCPIAGGRRMIPADYIPEIKRVLKTRARLETANA